MIYTVPLPPPWLWHVDVDTTRPARLRLIDALLLTGAGLRCGRCSRLVPQDFGRGHSALLVVEVPHGQEDAFRAIAKPIHMAPPPRLSVGMRRPPDDGHPGRRR